MVIGGCRQADSALISSSTEVACSAEGTRPRSRDNSRLTVQGEEDV